MQQNKSVGKAIILFILIGASAFVIVKYGFRKNPGAPRKTTPYICTTCGNVIEMKTESSIENTQDYLAKCPSCGTYTAKRGIPCVFCGKAYLPEDAQKKFGAKDKYRCVHCGKSLSDQGEKGQSQEK
jgi:DNA-directed RNA polymerase subunit RPC12/RpoP